jgi:hypothetical protein
LNDDADRRGVFGIAVHAALDALAVRVGIAGPLNRLSKRLHDGDLETLDGNRVTRRHDPMLPFAERLGPELRVRAGRLPHRRHVLHGGAVIDERLHR